MASGLGPSIRRQVSRAPERATRRRHRDRAAPAGRGRGAAARSRSATTSTSTPRSTTHEPGTDDAARRRADPAQLAPPARRLPRSGRHRRRERHRRRPARRADPRRRRRPSARTQPSARHRARGRLRGRSPPAPASARTTPTATCSAWSSSTTGRPATSRPSSPSRSDPTWPRASPPRSRRGSSPSTRSAPTWCRPPPQDPTPDPYLQAQRPWALDLNLEVWLNGERITATTFRDMYWTFAQQLAHVTVNGATTVDGRPLRLGDGERPDEGRAGQPDRAHLARGRAADAWPTAPPQLPARRRHRHACEAGAVATRRTGRASASARPSGRIVPAPRR